MSDKKKDLHLEIISPQGIVFDGYCTMATIPGTNGEMGIMNNHEPVLTSLAAGKINVYKDKSKVSDSFDVKSGFANNVHDKLLVLID